MWDAYQREDSIKLHEFISRTKMSEDGSFIPDRTDMNSDELAAMDAIRKASKDMAIIITEILIIMHLVKKIGDKDLYYIERNMQRIVHSLVKQRKLVKAVRTCLYINKPNDKELKAINSLPKDIQKRIDFLKEKIMPDNLLMTPIHEYIQMIGGEKAFTQMLYAQFRSREQLLDKAKSLTDMDFSDLADDILIKVSEAGLMDQYKSRIKDYVDMRKADDAARDKERHDNEIAKRHKECETGMTIFTNRLYKAIRELKPDTMIGIDSCDSLVNKIGRYKRYGYIVLKCVHYKGKVQYYYIQNNHQGARNLGAAHVFSNKEEAEKFKAELQEKIPSAAFEVVSMHIEW